MIPQDEDYFNNKITPSKDEAISVESIDEKPMVYK